MDESDDDENQSLPPPSYQSACNAITTLQRYIESKESKVECKVDLKTNKGTLYKSLASKNSEYLAESGGYFLRYFELSEITNRKDFLVPEGVLTVRVELRTQKTEDRPSKNPVITRVGKLQKLTDSPSSIVVSWTIKDFLNLPYGPTNGALSEDFDIPGGMAFIALHPDGTNNKQDFIRFMVTFMSPENEGLRNPEIECDVALKTNDGTLYKSLANKDSKYLAASGGYFLRYFELSKITDRKKSLLPGGVLTVTIKLSSQKNEDHPYRKM